ncbi:hypothetical protein CHLRE_09g386155v5 [Chlamydomonas reinhardtii]|uniref:Uncharacterized protein n=1 Tax=Chlamydomonas reinhardtii TaxID=3055 RepID=A0A2K3DCD5_CHLRE|nr:uncharacterized protein CHLRE_09g386155v5 [Chlamydomonas reinhardtii]PNW78189.1 hypothetical protein CHLRE_09g386155v5 [Chlamydomonas reinhardtii]
MVAACSCPVVAESLKLRATLDKGAIGGQALLPCDTVLVILTRGRIPHEANTGLPNVDCVGYCIIQISGPHEVNLLVDIGM